MMAVAETAGSCSESRAARSSARACSSKCRKTPESSSLYLSNKPVAHVICAQAAPKLIVKAGNSAALTADGQVNLLAAKNESSQASTNSNSSSSVGISYNLVSGWGVNASASKGQGKSDGQDTSYTNTTIAAGNIATIKSGSDTTLKGAVVTANTIKADVGQQFGGSLSIESLQYVAIEWLNPTPTRCLQLPVRLWGCLC